MATSTNTTTTTSTSSSSSIPLPPSTSRHVTFSNHNDPDEYGQVKPPSLAERCINSPLSRRMKARKPNLPPRKKYHIDYRNLGKRKKVNKDKGKKKQATSY